MGDLTDSQMTPSSATPASSNPRPMPVREDCWSEEATATLVDAWGRRYLELNRGNLRQKDWQEVADAVNTLHGHTKKTHRTDVQCKNRIDTIKKKYKVEKARVSSSNGTLVSSWRFFDRLDMLIGSQVVKKATPSPSPLSPSPPVAVPLAYRKITPKAAPAPAPAPVPTAVALPQKRSASAAALDGGFFRMNYSAVAAAAAAEDDDEDEDEDDDVDEVDEDFELERGRESGGGGGEIGGGEGMKRLARAIERFGEVYHRVEAEKLRQMVDLEKQRLQFANELEMERMRIFMDTQVQLQRIKHGKRSGSNDIYS